MRYLILILLVLGCSKSDCRRTLNLEDEHLYYIEGTWNLEGGKHWDSLIVVPSESYAYHGWFNMYSTTSTVENHLRYNWVNENSMCLGFYINDIDVIYNFTMIPDGFTLSRDTTFLWTATK